MADDPKPSAIVVESASDTRTDVDEPTEAPPVAAAVVDPPAKTAAETLDAKLDELEPPKADETSDERTARRSRSEKKILKEIALRKQAEDRVAALEAENTRLKAAPPPTPAGEKKADAATAAAPAAPTFKFQTYAEYQEQHPDSEYEQYVDARTDARVAWHREEDRKVAVAEHANERRRTAFATAKANQDAFRAEHPDFDDVTGDKSAVKVNEASPQYADVQTLLLREENLPLAPAIEYYLGSHPDDAARLFEAGSRTELLQVFGAIKYAATQQAAPAAPARPAARPTSAAPSPLSAVVGSSQHTRTLAQLAGDSEDASGYFKRRRSEMAER